MLLHPFRKFDGPDSLQFKSLKGLSLKESLAQFSSTMTAQTDLRVEAAHLRRFFRNFASVRASVTPPFPLPAYISDAVLIETFEPGEGPLSLSCCFSKIQDFQTSISMHDCFVSASPVRHLLPLHSSFPAYIS